MANVQTGDSPCLNCRQILSGTRQVSGFNYKSTRNYHSREALVPVKRMLRPERQVRPGWGDDSYGQQDYHRAALVGRLLEDLTDADLLIKKKNILIKSSSLRPI